MLAPLFVRPLSSAAPDECFCRLNEQGFDDYLKRSLYKKINISGSGIVLNSDVSYAPGSFLEVQFMLDDAYPGIIALCIEVLRVDMRPGGYLVAGRFAGMDDKVQKLIVNFISEREHRVRGRKTANPAV